MNTPPPVFSTVVHNYSGAPVRTQEVSDGRGGRRQEMIIGDMVATGSRTPQAQRVAGMPRTVSR